MLAHPQMAGARLDAWKGKKEGEGVRRARHRTATRKTYQGVQNPRVGAELFDQADLVGREV
jgi:hypothetical protein